eukprot:1182236-Prorocentrum_minimum.AAC.4
MATSLSPNTNASKCGVRVVAFREQGHAASTGLKGLAILLHTCAHVYVYGFIPDDVATDNFRSWYWDKYPGYTDKPPAKVLEKKYPNQSYQVWDFKGKWTSLANSSRKRNAGRGDRLGASEALEGSGADMLAAPPSQEGLQLTNGALVDGTSSSTNFTAVRTSKPVKGSSQHARDVEMKVLYELQKMGLVTIRHYRSLPTI